MAFIRSFEEKRMSAGHESPRVLISGGAAGAGLACAEILAAHGADLILADCDGVALTRAAERLGAFSRFCDAIGTTSVELFAGDMASLFPSIEVLINAAGRGYVRSLAMAKMTRAMLPLLRRSKGRRWIVNLECARASDANALFPYASSPPAFRSLLGMFEEELRGTGIEVLTIPQPLGGGDGTTDRAIDRETAQRVFAAICPDRRGWGHGDRYAGRRA